MKIAMACDHGGLRLKNVLKDDLEKNGYEVEDFGTYTEESCDYPDYASKAAKAVADGTCDKVVVVCGTGIGVSITANKVNGIRCSLCHDVFSAKATRQHNDSNMLAMGQRVIGEGLALEILHAWLESEYEGGRHDARIQKMMKDKLLFESVERELNRQRNNIELIASENFVSEEVLQLAGSVLTNKYAEGYPAKRYYGGCQFVDEVEELARQRICEIYGAEHANVQPHSGAQANTAVYLALLQHGDKVLGMSLADGGHLTHGHPLNFSGINYEFYSYGVSKETETIDYEEYKKKEEEIKPKLVVAGASAYSRIIDF